VKILIKTQRVNKLISKKVRELFVSLMEADARNNASMVVFDPKTEIYSGSFNEFMLNKFINEGVFEVVLHPESAKQN
jgi:hypothetical protein